MKPILFNTKMVKAILDGRKTVTRRLMKIQPWGVCDSGNEHQLKDIFKETPREFCCRECGLGVGPTGHSLFESPYQIGDIIYVRETWCDRWLPDGFLTGKERYGYKADGIPSDGYWGNDNQCKDNVWIPSIHMPKEAARIFLRVTGVRVERLQDITVEGAKREGALSRCQYCNHINDCCGELAYVALNCLYTVRETMRNEFQKLWDSTVDMKNHWMDQSWGANPWVWVIEFERCEKPEEV